MNDNSKLKDGDYCYPTGLEMYKILYYDKVESGNIRGGLHTESRIKWLAELLADRNSPIGYVNGIIDESIENSNMINKLNPIVFIERMKQTF